MFFISESLEKVSPAALALMLVVVFLSLYEAGFDHNVLYWVLLPLTLFTALLIYKNNIFINLSIKLPLLWYLLFLLWAGISIVWSLNPHRTMVEFLQINIYGIVVLLSFQLNEANIFRVGRIALITGLGISLFGISQFMFLTSSRIISTFTNPNPLGIFLVMLFLIGWGYYLRKPSRYLGITCLILLIALALTGSRGSFICLGIALPFILIGINRSECKLTFIKTFSVIALALIFTQIIVIIAPYLQEAVGSRTALTNFLTRPESFIARSGMARFNYWLVGLKAFLSEPFTGHGLGTFFLAYYTEYDGGRWYSRFAHNHYIQTMVELGIIGFGLFAGFFITAGKRTWELVKSKNYPVFVPGMIAACIAFLINIGAEFSWNFPGAAVIFFILTGSLISLNGNSTEKNGKKIKIIAVTILMVLFILTGWQLTANLLYRQGVILESTGDLQSTVKIYDQANTIYPINSMAFSFASSGYCRLYNENRNLDYLEKALEQSIKAVQLSPVDGNLHNQLGRLYWELGHMEEAEKHLALAVKYAAYRLNLFIDLALFYIHTEQFGKADEILRQAYELEEAAVDSARTDEDIVRVASYIEILEQLDALVKKQEVQ